jgi:hypothetical protein
VTRLAELEARRRMLLARCEAQRAELAQRMAQLHQSRPATLAAGGGAALPARHPLAWIAALGALMLLGRTRDVLKLLVWTSTALSLAARVAQLLRLIRDLRLRRTDAAR